MAKDPALCFFDVQQAIHYRTALHIAAEPIGTLAHSPMQEATLGPPFLLSKEQAEFIRGEKDNLQGESALFRALTEAGYYVVLGALYGCDFMIYRGDPLVAHAVALVFMEKELSPVRIVEITRLAAGCKKICLIAYFKGSELVLKQITRIHTDRPEAKPLPRVFE